jgi:hypothetical protein
VLVVKLSNSTCIKQALTSSYQAKTGQVGNQQVKHLERSVSVLQQQNLSSHSRICGAVGGLKKTQGNTSTTLVTKASSVIVQRRECAGPNLDRARGASLDTKESHNTPSESKQKHKEQPLSFSFSLLLFFSFVSFSSFVFFVLFSFQGNKIFCLTTKTKRLLHTTSTNSE